VSSAGAANCRDQRVGVDGAEDPLRVGEGLLEQGDGAAQVPGRLVGGGEVVSGGEGVGVVGAEDPLRVAEGLLEQVDGAAQVPGLPVGAGEVVQVTADLAPPPGCVAVRALE
jgi:hypothetical protein